MDISEHEILIMLSGLKCYTVFNFTINFALRIMEQGMVNKLHKRCVTHQLINYANTMSIHQSQRHYKVRWNYECFQQFLNPSRVDCSLLQIVNTQWNLRQLTIPNLEDKSRLSTCQRDFILLLQLSLMLLLPLDIRGLF